MWTHKCIYVAYEIVCEGVDLCFYQVFEKLTLLIISLFVLFVFFHFTRHVTETDIQGIEKRLLQTLEMIIVKKKR